MFPVELASIEWTTPSYPLRSRLHSLRASRPEVLLSLLVRKRLLQPTNHAGGYQPCPQEGGNIGNGCPVLAFLCFFQSVVIVAGCRITIGFCQWIVVGTWEKATRIPTSRVEKSGRQATSDGSGPPGQQKDRQQCGPAFRKPQKQLGDRPIEEPRETQVQEKPLPMRCVVSGRDQGDKQAEAVPEGGGSERCENGPADDGAATRQFDVGCPWAGLIGRW